MINLNFDIFISIIYMQVILFVDDKMGSRVEFYLSANNFIFCKILKLLLLIF